MSITRITSRNIQDYTIQIVDLHDLGVTNGGGLTANYYSGSLRNANVVIHVSSGNIVLTDNTTNYIEVDGAGVVSFNTSGFTMGSVPLATVVTLAGVITTITDERAWLSVDNNSTLLFIENETPTGTINGVNAVFTLVFTPNPSSSLELYLNGLHMWASGNDFTLAGATITFVTAQIPQTGDVLLASYRY